VVAVLDTGVRYTHEDLASNMWVNPNDGSHGWNVITGTNDPNDDQGHGTSVAGVLGAVGNNGKGVTGVAWQVQILAYKCFNNFGIGSISQVIAGMEYAKTNGARIINASWGFPASLALSNEVYSLRDSNIIVVAACGNSATDIDLNPTYPASYHFDNVVTVADTTRIDTLATASNYGATSVHLGAPGEQIYTTWSPNDSYYITQSGTSFAAPYVAGALALMLTKFPAESYQQVIARLLNATDPLPALAGKCVTGGRLNLHNALSPPINLTLLPVTAGKPFQLRVAAGPNRLCVIQATTDLMNWSPIFTNTTSTNGNFDFADDQSTNSTQRFYRATAAP
jgi:subtilisin family serine protease